MTCFSTVPLLPCARFIKSPALPLTPQTLQKYTREYLLEKFKADYQLQAPALSPSTSRSQRSPTVTRLPPLPHGSRPILAIDTAPTQITNRHPSVSVSRGLANGENTLPPMATLPELSPNTATSASQCLQSLGYGRLSFLLLLSHLLSSSFTNESVFLK